MLSLENYLKRKIHLLHLPNSHLISFLSRRFIVTIRIEQRFEVSIKSQNFDRILYTEKKLLKYEVMCDHHSLK